MFEKLLLLKSLQNVLINWLEARLVLFFCSLGFPGEPIV